jgi:ABC-2 type transport system permease protein
MIVAVLKKELATLWASPLPWIAGAALQAVLAVLFVDQLQGRGQAVVQPLFPIAGLLLVVAVPVLAMRAFAEEARTANLDALLAGGAPVLPLAVGKWLAAWLTSCAVLAPALLLAGLTALWGDPDTGPIVTGFLGLALLAAAVASIGVATSAATTSQAVAALVTILSGLVLWFVGAATGGSSAARALGSVSLSARLRTFASGGIDSGDVAFFAGVSAAGVLLAAFLVRRRLTALVAAALVALVAVWGSGTHALADLTAQETLTLSDVTIDVLAAVEDDVDVTAFIGRDDPGRVDAITLLDRYERRSRHVDVDVVDPDQRAGEAERFGIDPVLGGVVVRRGEDVELAAAATEQDVTSAIARLVRGRTPLICLTTGHGEVPLDPETLELAGYAVDRVDLLVDPVIPEGCEVVAVAAPASDLDGRASRALREWVDADGKLLALLDPVSTVDLGAVLAPYGLGIASGLVFEGDPASVVNEDEAAPIVRRYSSAHPVVRGLPPTYFPGVQEVTVDDDVRAPGLTVNRLADTSEVSYLETTPLAPAFDPGVDRGGPVTIAAAADRSRVVDETSVARTRLVVVGDVDFATTALDAAANRRFLLQAIGWLALDDDLIPLSSHLPRDRPLALTDARVAYARVLGVGVVPALLLIGYGLVWAVRRRR